MTSRIIIAIDGPSASGKGTLARGLAQNLGFAHMDTGALHRLVGMAALKSGGDPENEEDAVKAARHVAETFQISHLQDPALRTDEAGQAASKTGQFQDVRDAILHIQRDFAEHGPEKGAVLDGRDIGTVICPGARVKLYVTAGVEERAKRRYQELLSRGLNPDYETVLADMKQRDERDSNRAAAPLKPAEDAHLLDTTGLTADEVLAQALSIVQKITKGHE